MSHIKDIEDIVQEIEQHAVNAGRALADYFAQSFADGLREIDFERHRIAKYIFHRAAHDVLGSFYSLMSADQIALRDRATAAVKTGFETRRAEILGDQV